jgi:hypothetical protein
MGIVRQFFLILVIFFEVATKPMGERSIDNRNGFAKVSSLQRSPATARVIRNHNGESGISCSSPQRGLAEA